MALNAQPVIAYRNILEEAASTVTATREDASFPIENIFDRRPFRLWKADAAGTSKIRVDAGSAVSLDCLAFINHNLFTASGTVAVKSYTAGDWSTGVVTHLAAFTPASDKACLREFTSASKRYWEIVIVTSAVVPFIGTLFLSPKLQFPRHIKAPYDPAPESVSFGGNLSETGQILGVVKDPTTIRPRIDMTKLTDSFIRNTFGPAWDGWISQGDPVFIAWDVTNHAEDVYYCQLKPGDYSVPYDPNLRSLTLEFIATKEEGAYHGGL